MCSENLSISEKWDKFIPAPAWVFVKKLTVHENLKKKGTCKIMVFFFKIYPFSFETFWKSRLQEIPWQLTKKKSFDEKKDHWADMLYLSLVLSISPGWKANEIRY